MESEITMQSCKMLFSWNFEGGFCYWNDVHFDLGAFFFFFVGGWATIIHGKYRRKTPVKEKKKNSPKNQKN
jgi:hypothetical protein